MTLGEIIALVRDEAGVVGEGRVHTNYIKALVNQAQVDFARQTGLFVKELQTSTSAGKSTYELKTDFGINDFQRMNSVELIRDGLRTRVKQISIREEIDYFGSHDDASLRSIPIFYVMLGVTKIRFVPTPDAAYQVTLRYFSVPTPLVNMTDVTEIPVQYEMTIVNWCIFRVKQKLGHKDANTYLQLYVKEISDAISDKVPEDALPRMKPAQDIRGLDGIRVP